MKDEFIKKIVSGGQTGADRAALDFAIKHSIAYGGWVPKGKTTEDGTLPETYQLQEMPTGEYSKRTEQPPFSDSLLKFSNFPSWICLHGHFYARHISY